jgi:cation diffusion facilitator family transporter
MSDACCESPSASHPDHAFRRVLWIVLAINIGMFAVEVVSALVADSLSLLADSVDFLGDAANYGVSLFVLGMSLRARAWAALLKAATMAGFGLWVLAGVVLHLISGSVPQATIMGAVGGAALAANVTVALLLYAHRKGDSNRRSVWLCSRNDVLGNLAVLAAAGGVHATTQGWPDLLVASAMAALALTAAWQVMRQARGELRPSLSRHP